MTDTVDKLIIQSELQGGDQTATGLKKIEGGLDGIAVASDNVEKSTTSIESKFASLERRFGTTRGQADQFAKIQGQVNLALAQNPALQDRANELLGNVAAKFTAGGIAAKGAASELGHLDEIGAVLESRMSGLGNSMGLIGQVLQVIGPVGLAAAVGVGALAVAFNYLNEQANKFGDASINIRAFGETTGLTTTEVRGLSEAAAQVGIGGDQIKTAFERFTFSLGDARKQTGALYDGLREIDPELADQVARTRSGAEAWDLLAKAISSTSDATVRAQLARAALNREGVRSVPVLLATDAAGGIDKYSEEVQKTTGITDELTKHTASLRAEIEATKKLTEEINASIYTEAVLNRMKAAADFQLQIAKAAKEAANLPGGATQQWQNPFVQETNRSAGIASPPPIPQGSGGSGITADTAAITAQMAAITANAKAVGDLGAAYRQAKTDEEGAANAGSQMVALLGGAATGAEIADAKFHKLSAAFLENKFGASDSADAIDKFNRALHGDTSNTVAALQDQRTVIEAVGFAEKSAAQEAANFNAMVRAGKDPLDAEVIASNQLANAQAAVAAAAAAAHLVSQDQLAIAQALTVPQREQAQFQADYNAELLKTGDSLLAQQAASDKFAISQAAAQASAQKMVQSSQDNLDKIQAQGTGMEGVVASSIAYRDAIAAGATSTQAAAIAANTLSANLMQAQAAADKIAVDAANAATTAALNAPGAKGNSLMANGVANFQTDGKQFTSVTAGAFDSYMKLKFAGLSDQDAIGVINAAIAHTAYVPASGPLAPKTGSQLIDSSVAAGGIGAGISTAKGLGDISSVGTLYDILNSQTGDKNVQSSNMATELAWLNTLPESIARDQAIQTLMQSIDQLTTSTNNLNSTNQDLLSPYYTQDPRTSHIGFRSQGMSASNTLPGMATGGDITVPGGYSANDNMMLPVASGEDVSVRRPGQAGGSSTTQYVTITNSIMVPPGADTNAIGRTVFQQTQNAMRQFQAVSR
jgi:hypothetical protein